MKSYTKEELEKMIQSGEDLSGIDLKGLNLQGANFKYGKFRGANFRYTNLSEADLTGADLRECNLRHASFIKSILIDTDIRDADLTHADLSGAVVIRLKYGGAKMEKVKGVSKKKFFFTQSLLDELFEKGKATFERDILTVKGVKNEVFRIKPAFRVSAIEAGEDTNGLLGKIKTQEELEKMGLEIYMDTAILGDDIVYKLELGVIGVKDENLTSQPEKESPSANKTAEKSTHQKTAKESETQKTPNSEDLLNSLTEYLSKKIK